MLLKLNWYRDNVYKILEYVLRSSKSDSLEYKVDILLDCDPSIVSAKAMSFFNSSVSRGSSPTIFLS